MRSFRTVIATIMSLSLLFGLAPSALAGSATHYAVRLNNATIPWVYPPPVGLSSSCSQIPEGVHINPDDYGSDRVKNVNITDMGGGGKHALWTDLVKGTATDNFGTAYTFVYKNNTTFAYDGSIVNVDMKDTFHLKGGDVNFTVGFHWRWQYPADSFEVVQVVDENGQTVDIGVDPFFFPPDPNLVPGSWQQINNRGDPDPLSCDPL